MSGSSRKFVAGVVLVLGIGALIGWVYGRADWGLLVAALAVLGWQIRQLLAFERALRTNDFDDFRYGEGIWQQIFSRFSFEQERAVRRKREYRRLLKEIRKSTDAMPDGAIIVDANNEIVMCNRAAKALAGFKPKKDRGQRVDNILRDPAVTELLQAEDYSQAIEIPSPVQDGGWLHCRVVPYGANQKLLFLRDVSNRIRLNRMRRDFVANASHELRSPLTVVSGYLDSLAEDPGLPSNWAQPVSQMQLQARRMKRIISELLELSRLESSGTATTDEIIDVNGLLVAAKNTYRGRNGIAGIEVVSDSSAQLRGSRNEIESLITNLISNAVRHTPADGRIGLSWRSGPDGADLTVSDSGEGIAAEHIPRLTERFFRVDRGRSRDDGGVGLGLAIVKHVISRHNGELVIESELGAGSQFHCHFPSDRVVIEPPIPLAGDAHSA